MDTEKKQRKPEHEIFTDVKHITSSLLINKPEVFAYDRDYYYFEYEGYQLTINREMVNMMRHKLAHHFDAEIREMFKEW